MYKRDSEDTFGREKINIVAVVVVVVVVVVVDSILILQEIMTSGRVINQIRCRLPITWHAPTFR